MYTKWWNHHTKYFQCGCFSLCWIKNKYKQVLCLWIFNVHDVSFMSDIWYNRFMFHIGKTSCMLVTSAQRRRRMSQDHLDLSLNDNQIEHVKASPYLGITIDQNLNFNIQTNNICNKANRALGALKRAAPFLPIDTRALMFNSMVLPHLDYCCTIWGTTSNTNIGKLQKIQNRGMRIILQCHPRTHIADMLSNLNKELYFWQLSWYSKLCIPKLQITCLTGWSLFPIITVQGDPPVIFLYPDHTQIRSLPKALDSGISYQHPFELSQTSRHSRKPQLSSLHIISTSTNQHYTSHIHKHLHNISAWLHIPSYHLT